MTRLKRCEKVFVEEIAIFKGYMSWVVVNDEYRPSRSNVLRIKLLRNFADKLSEVNLVCCRQCFNDRLPQAGSDSAKNRLK
jgi:hypothetical protein